MPIARNTDKPYLYTDGGFPGVAYGSDSPDIGKILILAIPQAIYDPNTETWSYQWFTGYPLIFTGYTWEAFAHDENFPNIFPICGGNASLIGGFVYFGRTMKNQSLNRHVEFRPFYYMGGWTGASALTAKYRYSTLANLWVALASTSTSLGKNPVGGRWSYGVAILAPNEAATSWGLWHALADFYRGVAAAPGNPITPSVGGSYDFGDPTTGRQASCFFGGYSGGLNLTNVSTYNGTAWVAKTAMPIARRYAYIATLQNGVFYSGGDQLGVAIIDSRYYHFLTDSHAVKADLPLPARKSGISGEIESNKAIAATGFSGASVWADTDIYSFISDSWTTATDYPTAVAYPGGGTRGCYAHGVGGSTNTGLSAPITSHYRYNSLTNSWSTLASITTAVSQLAGMTV